MENHPYHPHRRSIFWPLMFILGGLILLLSNLNLLGAQGWNTLWSLWPLLLIIGGIDSIYRENHFIGPLVFIGLGSILLLNNLGYLNFSWQTLINLWPVLLIALGLDIIIGHKSTLGSIVGLVLGIVLVASVVWLIVSVPWIGQVNHYQSISQPLAEIKGASIELEPTFGNVQINSGSQAANLIDGRVRQLSDETRLYNPYTVNDRQGNYQLRNNDFYLYPVSAVTSTSPDWDIKLTSAVPIELDSSMVMGNQELILNLTKVNVLDSETILGRMVVALPRKGFEEGRIQMVIGQTVVYVPRGVNMEIKTDTVLVPVTFPSEFERKGNIISNIHKESGETIHLDISNVIGTVNIEFEP